MGRQKECEPDRYCTFGNMNFSAVLNAGYVLRDRLCKFESSPNSLGMVPFNALSANDTKEEQTPQNMRRRVELTMWNKPPSVHLQRSIR